jgi:hypothetical protein
VADNISAVEFRNDNLLEDVCGILESTGLTRATLNSSCDAKRRFRSNLVNDRRPKAGKRRLSNSPDASSFPSLGDVDSGP